jgi:Lipid A 3-O-deacylase (PagL)
MKPSVVASLVVFLIFGSAANAQIGDSASFGRTNTYSVFLEYSNDSSRIVLGSAPNRKLVGLGVQYERRLVSNRALVWRYTAEFRPLILVSDPLATDTFTTISPPPPATIVAGPDASFQCIAGSLTASSPNPTTGIPTVYTLSITCSRRWTFAQGFSPAGTRVNLLPHRRLQPTVSFLTGYMLSAKKIPVDTAGSFNFTFEFGAGLEFYQSQSRSMRLEYQIQHFSNAGTGQTNPGVDNGLFKLTYSFGR